MKKIFFAAICAGLFGFTTISAQAQDAGSASANPNAPQTLSANSDGSQAQDAGAASAPTQETNQQSGGQKFSNLFGGFFTPPKSGKEFLSQISPFVTLGTAITINTESKLKSAPSPAAFAFSIGAIWPNKAFLSFQPRLSFWTGYYLWDGQNALPAEIENRTALALNFMLDIPAAATFRFKHCRIEAGLGLGILARVALMAGGVGEWDTGVSGSAGSDKEKIQEWFWSSARFLYPELFVAWEWNFTKRIAAGLEARYYFPLGSVMDGRGLDASIISLGAKLIF